MAKKRLSEEDLALWRGVAAQAEPLGRPGTARKRTPTPAPAKPAKQEPAAPPPAAPPVPQPAAPPVAPIAPVLAGQSPDRRTQTRLKRGQIAIEAKLDLHGLTQGEAHEELRRFIAGSREQGRRCVLIVTGTGVRSGGRGGVREAGVLRRSVPRWLAEPALREAVLGVAPAEPRHGGQGALYVLLRKRRAG
jgi:DNA-nicking Smr family endonuclease